MFDTNALVHFVLFRLTLINLKLPPTFWVKREFGFIFH